jgi:N-carbamoyl-L-amino-acid hydrolase
MLKQAALVLAARAAATRHGCVATVGKVRVEPGGVNAIASNVTMWVDARGADEAAVRRVVTDLEGAAAPHGSTLTEESWTPTTRFDPDLVRRLAHALGPDTPVLGTGAGHDAGILATHGIPSAMLFIRNPTGVSHSPAEHADEADCHAGVAALTAVLAELSEATA